MKKAPFFAVFIGLTTGNFVYQIPFQQWSVAIERSFFQLAALGCIYYALRLSKKNEYPS
jgi:hypothetical protein